MENVISKSKLEKFLKQDGNINKLIDREEQASLRRLLFGEITKWEKISTLPEYVYNFFETKMRSECFVTEGAMSNPPSNGPHIIFKKERNNVAIKIDSTPGDNGIVTYRRCLTVVAYYVGILGGRLNPSIVDDIYVFSDEDWLFINIAARYCLLPEKLIKKVYILTQLIREENESERERPFIRSFQDNLMHQAGVPEWVVLSRLKEHAFANNEFAELIQQPDIETLVEEYRKNEHYSAVLV